MNCISISYKTASEEIRGKISFSIDIQKKISEMLDVCVILCTCNRTELYFEESYEKALEIIAEYGNICMDTLKKYAMIFKGKKAIFHLFKVACGIESMVIGEDEILGQVKNSYYHACEWEKTNREINVIFQSAIACAKQIKTTTSLSNISISIATLTSNEVAKFCDYPKVLIIGASGKIGQTIVKNLTSHKNTSITITLRNHMPEMIICEHSQIETIRYQDRYEMIDQYDCIISATSGPHYTITYNAFAENLKTTKKRLMIDLAVPHDIDRKIGEMEHIQLLGIDHFELLAKENNLRKVDSVEIAIKYISSEIETLEKSLLMQKFLDDYKLEESEIKILGRLKKQLDSEQFSAVINAMKKEQ